MARRHVCNHHLIAKPDRFSVVDDLIGCDRRKSEGIAEPKIVMPAAAEQRSIAFAGQKFCAGHLLKLS